MKAAIGQVRQAIEALSGLKRGPLLVAVDGRSGAGKSMLATAVTHALQATLVPGDDFYSGGDDQKWASKAAEEKLAEVIDWRRLRFNVLEPLLRGETASWYPLDFDPGIGWVGWKTHRLTANPAPVVVLDGVYSGRLEFSDLVDLAILVEARDEIRRSRLIAREGEHFMRRWHQLWDEVEDLYFSTVRPRESFDLVVVDEGHALRVWLPVAEATDQWVAWHQFSEIVTRVTPT